MEKLLPQKVLCHDSAKDKVGSSNTVQYLRTSQQKAKIYELQRATAAKIEETNG